MAITLVNHLCQYHILNLTMEIRKLSGYQTGPPSQAFFYLPTKIQENGLIPLNSKMDIPSSSHHFGKLQGTLVAETAETLEVAWEFPVVITSQSKDLLG